MGWESGKWRQRLVWFSFAFLLLLLEAGCATESSTPVYVTSPEPPSDEVRSQIGPVAIRGAELQPAILPDRLSRGRGAALSAFGAVDLFLGTAGQALHHGGGEGAGYAFLGAMAISPVVAAGGAVYGTTLGMSKRDYNNITAILRKAVEEENPPGRLNDEFSETIRRIAPEIPLVAATTSPEALTILQVQPLTFEIGSPRSMSGPMQLTGQLRISLLRASDGTELYHASFGYFGPEHTLRQWGADGGSRFRQAIHTAVLQIAEQVADRLFLVYSMPGGFLETRNIVWDTKK